MLPGHVRHIRAGRDWQLVLRDSTRFNGRKSTTQTTKDEDRRPLEGWRCLRRGGLLEDNSKRTATVVSAEPRINSNRPAGHVRVIRSIHIKDIAYSVDFLQNVPLFAGRKMILMPGKQLNFQVFPANTRLWNEGDAVDSIRYMPIIRRGEIRCIKSVTVNMRSKKPGWRDSNPWTTRQRPPGQPGLRADVKPHITEVCVLGPNTAFLERTMFEFEAQRCQRGCRSPANRASASRHCCPSKHTNRTAGAHTGYSLLHQVAWLSKHEFDKVFENGANPNYLADVKERIIDCPSDADLRASIVEDRLWAEYKRALFVAPHVQ